MAQLSRAERAAQSVTPVLEAPAVLAVECNVCHVRGVIDLDPADGSRIAAGWGSLKCVFTEECIGHIWPEAVN